MAAGWEANSLVGQTLGQFQIKGELGRGGMAVVYKGYQPSLDRWVAIKTLPKELSGKREMVSRFHREAEAMVSLNHSNIVQIIDKGEDRGLYYFAMEFVDGPSLSGMLKEEQLSMDLMFDIALQVAEGLDYAHKKGIVHRDIKPGNVLWDSATSLAKIADFGIARLTKKPEEMITLTATNVGMGTVSYMAPEQKTDAGSVDHRADIYSLGVMIYEMFTGQLPQGRFKLPSELNPALPRKLDEIVTRSMEPDPNDRYPDMATLKADLEAARQAAQGSGTLIRSVRDAAERTLTAMAGKKGGGGRLFGCFLFLALLGGGGAAAVKLLVLDPAEAELAAKGDGAGDGAVEQTAEDGSKSGAAKTGASAKTGATKTDGNAKTALKTIEGKTGGGKTGASKTIEGKTGEGKTGTSKTIETKTGEGKTGASKTIETKTGETKNGSIKTGELKNGETKVGGVGENPAVAEAVATEARALRTDLTRVRGAIAAWRVAAPKVDGALKDAEGVLEKAAEGPKDQDAITRLKRRREALLGEASAALYAQADALRAAARKAPDPELRAAEAQSRALWDRALGLDDPAEKLAAYDRVLRALVTAKAQATAVRAEAALAAARVRVDDLLLGEAQAKLKEGAGLLGGGRPVEAQERFEAAIEGARAAQPVAPRGLRHLWNAPVSGLTKNAQDLCALAPAPGRGLIAVCASKEEVGARLFVFRFDGQRLRRAFEAPVLANAGSVACAGVDADGNLAVWVGTMGGGSRSVARRYLFRPDGSLVSEGSELDFGGEWLYDLEVGPDGRLYALLSDHVRVFAREAQEERIAYEVPSPRGGFLPRRLAVLGDGRLVVSCLDEGANLANEWIVASASSGWRFRLWQARAGQRASELKTGFNPSALATVGDQLLAHDHGHGAGNNRHLKLFAKDIEAEPLTLTQRVLTKERARLAQDMVHSGGVVYVLFALGPPEKNMQSRDKLLVYLAE